MTTSSIKRNMFAASCAFSLGQGLYMTIAVVYAIKAVHVRAEGVGFIFSFAGLLALGITLPSGYISDRFNTKRLSIVMSVLMTIALLAVAAARGYVVLLIFVGLSGALVQANSVIRKSMISHLVTAQERVTVQAWVRSAYNAGFAVGAAISGAVLAVNSAAALRWLIVGAAGCYLMMGVATYRLPSPSQPTAGQRNPFVALSDRRYIYVTLVNAILSLHITVLDVAIPLWIIQETDAPTVMVGVLLVINTVQTVILQVRLSRSSDNISGAIAAMVRSSGLFVAACLLFMVSRFTTGYGTDGLLIGAVLVLTLCELLQSAGSWGLSFGLAPAEARGRYLAVFGYGTALQSAIGPTAVTFALTRLGAWGWLLLAALLVAGGMLIQVVRPWLEQAREEPGIHRPAQEETA